jgi:hypothetical protein
MVLTPEYIRWHLSAMALYLNQREVRTAFAWHPNDAAPAATAAEGTSEA